MTMAVTQESDPLDRLSAQLVDDFARNLLVGAQRVLADADNPIRLHMFATTIRELFSYSLHNLAPDAEITECAWFEQVPDTSGPTRRQRVCYAIHGGLDPTFVTDTLLLDVEDMSGSVVGAIDELSRFTHVRPNTLITDAEAIAEHGRRTLVALSAFLDDVEECKTSVASALEEHIHDAVYEALSNETLLELDEIAGHYWIEGHSVDNLTIDRIDHQWIYVSVEGSVDVGLQWGSNSDIRHDMGAVGEESFPFRAGLKAPVERPTSVESDGEGPAAVDTSSWWDRYYDPADDFSDPDEEDPDEASSP